MSDGFILFIICVIVALYASIPFLIHREDEDVKDSDDNSSS